MHSACLLQVYAQQAEMHAKQGDAGAAARFYTQCRDAALQCGDVVAAGAAAHHLGLLAQQQGDWQQALEHQRCACVCGLSSAQSWQFRR